VILTGEGGTYTERWWSDTDRESRNMGKGEHILVPLCSRQISHELGWNRTREFDLRSRLLNS
jgi:hypothetical protein